MLAGALRCHSCMTTTSTSKHCVFFFCWVGLSWVGWWVWVHINTFVKQCCEGAMMDWCGLHADTISACHPSQSHHAAFK
jgi:hypothetical protein